MKLSQAFPSNYLKADDLGGQSVTVRIESVNLEEIGQGRDKEKKLVLTFVGKKKAMVCNKTNAGTIAKLYGDDTDGWINQPVTLQPREVEFQGDMVLAIRVSMTKPALMGGAAKVAKPAAKVEPELPPDDPGHEPEDDDVPF